MALMSSGLVLLCGCLIQVWLGQPWVIAEAALTLDWQLAHRGVLGAGSGAALCFNGGVCVWGCDTDLAAWFGCYVCFPFLFQ